MDELTLPEDGNTLHLGDFANASKLVVLPGELSRKAADLALHLSDLRLALNILEAMNGLNAPDFVHEALWQSAVMTFMKCFTSGVRASAKLDPLTIYADRPPEALMNWEFFKGLRDKNLAHDVNAYSRCLPVAVLNHATSKRKIETVRCISHRFSVLSSDSYNNLKLICEHAVKWTKMEFDRAMKQLQDDFEEMSYDELAALPTPSVTAPDAAAMRQRRT